MPQGRAQQRPCSRLDVLHGVDSGFLLVQCFRANRKSLGSNGVNIRAARSSAAIANALTGRAWDFWSSEGAGGLAIAGLKFANIVFGGCTFFEGSILWTVGGGAAGCASPPACRCNSGRFCARLFAGLGGGEACAPHRTCGHSGRLFSVLRPAKVINKAIDQRRGGGEPVCFKADRAVRIIRTNGGGDITTLERSQTLATGSFTEFLSKVRAATAQVNRAGFRKADADRRDYGAAFRASVPALVQLLGELGVIVSSLENNEIAGDAVADRHAFEKVFAELYSH